MFLWLATSPHWLDSNTEEWIGWSSRQLNNFIATKHQTTSFPPAGKCHHLGLLKWGNSSNWITLSTTLGSCGYVANWSVIEMCLESLINIAIHRQLWLDSIEGYFMRKARRPLLFFRFYNCEIFRVGFPRPALTRNNTLHTCPPSDVSHGTFSTRQRKKETKDLISSWIVSMINVTAWIVFQ